MTTTLRASPLSLVIQAYARGERKHRVNSTKNQIELVTNNSLLQLLQSEEDLLIAFMIQHKLSLDSEHSSTDSDVDGVSRAPSNNMLRRWGYLKRKYSPRTYFNLNDVPDEKRGKWRRIQNRDEGKYSNDTKRNWEKKFHEIKSFIGQLRLPKNQKESAVKLALSQDANEYSSYGGRRALALAAVVYLVNQRRQEYEGFEFGDRVEEDDDFKQLVEKHDIDIIPAKEKLKRVLK